MGKRYYDYLDREIRAGMHIRFVGESEIIPVAETQDAEGNSDLGISASYEKFLQAHQNQPQEFYSLSSFDAKDLYRVECSTDAPIVEKDGFRLYEDLTSISDSMQYDSGTCIAELLAGSSHVTLEVQGDVRVTVGDETYHRWSEFSDEIKEAVRSGDIWDSDFCDEHDISVGNNNWFEVFWWTEGYNNVSPESDVIDFGGLSPEEMKLLLEAFLELCPDPTKEESK